MKRQGREPVSTILTELARAKVNLFLHVVGRRPDGFHLLDSLAVFPGVGDRLSMTPASALSIAVTGPFSDGLAAEPNNLVLRAARGFGASMGRSADFAFRLTKNLPVASGIGGGSADAAAACRLIARHWNCPMPDFLAEPLGADVPVCIASEPARMGGIGEVLTAAPKLPAFGMVLVEAAMLGRPMISCEIGTGTSFVNTQEETGLVVSPEDPIELAGAMLSLEKDEALARRFGESARKRYEQLFSGPALGQAYGDLYRRVLKT
ncbi:4-(cytidine 5'-diphospho)-2-C-methyl-D-erythritol kinase [Acidiphilium sp. 34-64-41]|uniref:4-(cytidine 5'-diphospho)-2-C-methyl-D-erythritol kinase n=1 Tax=Acidiphilium sp. 34-64-41 TaxID=1970297 RepID=UPI000BD120E6|nr:4-(cytidine 5'-diphospho)-2-C-methyl-D-erythritol kinase [Acidiphilium sp. 34-64-41]OZB23739.1 MAG: 4-(cytidine 5'-diphospho)-2-C-methyl-D-erythritol kinase [Acidiphilium sp. 34-64-41]